MKPRLVLVYCLIVLTPLALLAWVGSRMVKENQRQMQEQMERLLQGRLSDLSHTVQMYLRNREKELLRLTRLQSFRPEAIREHARQYGFVRQLFVIGPDSRLSYPSPTGPWTQEEEAFLLRTRKLFSYRVDFGGDESTPPLSNDEDLPNQPPANLQPNLSDQQILEMEQQQEASSQTQQRSVQQARLQVRQQANRPLQQLFRPPRKNGPSHGWHAWYWERGVHLLFWRRDEYGRVIGAEIPRVRLLSDLVGLFPDTGLSSAEGRIVLLDANGKRIYQWGAYEPKRGDEPAAMRSLLPPLKAWSLEYYLPADMLKPKQGEWMSVLPSVLALALALVGLAVYFYRENNRALREAAQRVSFVNQVSHELRTPLTNIRMYAELLENQVDEEDPAMGKRVSVILTETERLSRLIGNVLTFSRQQRQALKLHPVRAVPDRVIERVTENFRPAFVAKGIEPKLELNAGGEVTLDVDALEQILGNLLGNVEKYAPDGKSVTIASSIAGDVLTVTVQDHGPGIPAGKEETVFQPFVRLSEALTEGVAGTGIGLSIARALARMHGGELKLVPSEHGACFEITLRSQ